MDADSESTGGGGDARSDAWLAALQRAEIRVELERIYASASAEIVRRGPACWASGRCCNFDKTGHGLYVTGLEAAYLVSRLDADGVRAARRAAGARPERTGHSLSLTQLASARASGGCPFQTGNLCSVHATKPLGCRVYFCDRSAQAWQQDLSERLLGEIRRLHDEHGVEYRYGEWREMLGGFARARE